MAPHIQMARNLLRFLPLLAAVFFALGMGMFWAVSRNNLPVSTPVVGAPGAYHAAALVGIGVLLTMVFQEHRIRELEKKLQDREPPANGAT